MKRALLLCAIVVIGCGASNSPTSPSTPAPQPIAAATLQSSGQSSWANCLLGTCTFQASLQNVGTGCATGTTVVARFFDANNAQIGSDTQMGAVGTSLSARTIRPQEVVALGSIQDVSGTVANATRSVRLLPSWTNVRCP